MSKQKFEITYSELSNSQYGKPDTCSLTTRYRMISIFSTVKILLIFYQISTKFSIVILKIGANLDIAGKSTVVVL